MRSAVFVLMLSALGAAFGAHAALGDVDSSFSPSLPASCGGPIVPLADGGAYVGLNFINSVLGNSTAGVARIDATGKAIPSWGASGSVKVPSGLGFNAVRQILPAADGAIYVLDTDTVTRIDSKGLIDRDYGIDGRARPVGFQPLLAAVQSDGTLVVSNQSSTSIAFARIDEHGNVDPTFGSAAPVVIPWTRGMPYGWAVRNDGVIEIAVREGPQLTPMLYIWSPLTGLTTEAGRLLPHGAASWLSPIAKADPQGGLVFASNLFLTRYAPDGSLDLSFGINGVAELPALIGVGLWRDVDGSWITASKGPYNIGLAIIADDWVRLAKYTASGQRDGWFPSKSLGFPSSVVRQPDGSFLGCDGKSFRDSTLVKFSADSPRAEATVVEYYHPVLDHYFMTSTPAEIAGLDSNPLGWVRTGQSFGGWSPSKIEGAAHVCRFYGDPVIGPNSHFYTGEDFECEGLERLDQTTPRGVPAWHLEAKPFDMALPKNGACPANLLPVYRVFNGIVGTVNGPNHRYTTDLMVYAQMIAKGWAAEGVHFCAPPPID